MKGCVTAIAVKERKSRNLSLGWGNKNMFYRGSVTNFLFLKDFSVWNVTTLLIVTSGFFIIQSGSFWQEMTEKYAYLSGKSGSSIWRIMFDLEISSELRCCHFIAIIASRRTFFVPFCQNARPFLGHFDSANLSSSHRTYKKRKSKPI